MLTEKFEKKLDKIAETEGYRDRNELLYDYGVLPTVRAFIPKHKKFEFRLLLLKYMFKK